MQRERISESRIRTEINSAPGDLKSERTPVRTWQRPSAVEVTRRRQTTPARGRGWKWFVAGLVCGLCLGVLIGAVWKKDDKAVPDNEMTSGVLDNSEKMTSGMSDNREPDPAAIGTGYYYTCLDETEKAAYRHLAEEAENMKSGTAVVHFESSAENSSEENLKKIGRALIAYHYDHPETFYLDLSRMEYVQRGNDLWLQPSDVSYLSEQFSGSEEVNAALDRVKQVVDEILKNKTDDTLQNIIMAHDALVNHISYDQSMNAANTHDIYGAFVNGTCVCEGYAMAFLYLMNQMEIPAAMITGTATNEYMTGPHGWNVVQVDGAWYAVDVTWDDPVVIGGGTPDKERRYQYLLRGAAAMNSSHIASSEMGSNYYTLPEISESDYYIGGVYGI